jgi:hypothetical protein
MKTLIALAFLASACVGSIESGGGSTGPDAGTTGGGGGGGGGSGSGSGSGSGTGSGSGSGNNCINQVTGAAVSSGHHNPGQDCQGACHNHGFTLSGTLYDTTKTTPLAGATIVAVDANGATINLVSGTNGNFYTANNVAYPVKITASMCPNVSAMSSTVSLAGCNGTACHSAGSTQGPIHLP